MPFITGGVVSPGRESLLSLSLGSPALGGTADVHAAVTDTGVQQVVTTAITNPPEPRNITATAGGTANDIKAIQVIIAGTNVEGVPITETLPPFTVNTAGTVVGNKAFATVTSYTLPPHDGTGATTAIGLGAKLGIGLRLKRNTILNAHLANVKEGTLPTMAVSASAIESNTAELNSALDATEVVLDFHTTVAA